MTKPNPRVIALLSFYNEANHFLAATIASLAKVPVDHLIVADGAYALYPNASAFSGVDQHEIVQEVATTQGLGVTFHTPSRPWEGEIEKRNLMFRLADQVAEPNVDWYLVIDADELVREVDVDLRQALAETDKDTVAVNVFHRLPLGERGEHEKFKTRWGDLETEVIQDKNKKWRKFYRAIPGIEVVGRHYLYKTPDGRLLWGNGVHEKLVPHLDLSDSILLEHRTEMRSIDRQLAQEAYYARRSDEKIEMGECLYCGEQATSVLPGDFRLAENGRALDSGMVEVCNKHVERVVIENERQIQKYGFKPTLVEEAAQRALRRHI